MEIFKTTTSDLGKKTRRTWREACDPGLWIMWLFVWIVSVMIFLALAMFNPDAIRHDMPLLVKFVFVLMGPVSFAMSLRKNPDARIIGDLLLGNPYRLTKRYTGTAKIIKLCETSSDTETRRLTTAHESGWPYGSWCVMGEKFLIVEIKHDSERYRTGMKVKDVEFALAQPGASVSVKYQLARGPKGTAGPILAKIAT